MHRSLSQCRDEFEYFADKFELDLDSDAPRNPYLIVVLVDFNAQTNGWYSLGKTTYERTRIDGITSQFGLEQLIIKPTHIIGESMVSNGKNHFKIGTSMAWLIYLIGLSKKYYINLFCME